MNISTSVLMEALRFYSSKGYAPIDVPLVVDMDVSEHTKPKGVPELYHGKVGGEHKCYVASAEQSFIQLHKEGKLKDGMYMAVTPCYRHERFTSDTHYLMFMKLELIAVGVEKWQPYEEGVLRDAFQFFENELNLNTVTTNWKNNSCDILDSKTGIELGSYGHRLMPDGTGYIYGTGCAFPRISL